MNLNKETTINILKTGHFEYIHVKTLFGTTHPWKKTYSGKPSVTLLEIHNKHYHLFTNYKKTVRRQQYFRSKANVLGYRFIIQIPFVQKYSNQLHTQWPNVKTAIKLNQNNKLKNRKCPNYVHLFVLLTLDLRLKVY